MFKAVVGALGVLVAILAIYVINVVIGFRSASRVDGTISGLALQAPVQVLRDGRGIPHIRASNEHDLFFAQGYVEAADRGFQLDLLRRFVYGQLSEVLGKTLLSADEEARILPIAQLVQVQYQRLEPRDRALLGAFADGINAAYARETTPVEFRLLLYKPRPWKPEDTLAVGFATTLDLTDSWNDVISRAHKTLRLTDPCYDAPVTEGLSHVANVPGCENLAAILHSLGDRRPPVGSNEWAAGAAHTTTGRALLANDPHLRLQVPGVWYLVDLQAPGYHAAGATLAGVPGIILGHNDRIAWGATNGTTTSLSVFDSPASGPAHCQKETFHVRLGGDVTRWYYRTAHEFGISDSGSAESCSGDVVRWHAYEDPVSPIATFEQLDRARNIAEALAALRAYPGPTQNFELADTSGKTAYHLAGFIPNDPLWGSGIHRGAGVSYPGVPFDALPHVVASRDAVVWTANNKMYGNGYPYRLSAEFAPPYRAYRVAQLLRARKKYDIAYFTSMQMDTLSVAERELAKLVPQLRGWDGRFDRDSRDATAIADLRTRLAPRYQSFTDEVISARAVPSVLASIPIDPPAKPWSIAGAVAVKHPLAGLGISFLNGTTFAGNGDAYTVHMQKPGFSQSFRAVWDIGNWDAGGISIPQGESGRPGSGHYTDEASDWVAGRLLRLPYSDAAVERATVDRLTLVP